VKQLTPQLDVVAYHAPPGESALKGATREGQPWSIGIDIHKKESQICILAEDGELIERRVRTEPTRFAEVLGERPPARILIEAATESEWPGVRSSWRIRTLRRCNAARHRKVKTDANR
jgi:hypothetical protein